MNPVEVKFTIDIDNDKQVTLLKNFIADLKGTADGQYPVVAAKVETVRTKTEAVEHTNVTTTAATTTSTNAGSNAAEKKVDIDTISKKIGELVPDHRDTIVAELNRLGVARAGELPEDKLPEFYKFLCEIK